jgi:hypothetical protein
MKTIKRTFAIVISLTAVLWAAQSARAFYNPEIGRWANRDPIGEAGGINLFEFASDAPINSYDPDGLFPPSNGTCKALAKKIANLEKEIADRTRELYDDPLNLPSWDRKNHQKILNMMKANLAKRKALYQANCTDPEPPSSPTSCPAPAPVTTPVIINPITPIPTPTPSPTPVFDPIPIFEPIL